MSTFGHSYFFNACYLPLFVSIVYYFITIIYYPTLFAYHLVSIACPISSLFYIYIKALKSYKIDKVLIFDCPVQYFPIMLKLIKTLFSLFNITFGRIKMQKNPALSLGRYLNLNLSILIIGTTMAH